jgi:hypothetical protein
MHLSIAIRLALPGAHSPLETADRKSMEYAGPLATFVAQLATTYLPLALERGQRQRMQIAAVASYQDRFPGTPSRLNLSV